MASTYVPIATTTGNGSAVYVEFTSIDQTYTDLVLVIQAKSSTGSQNWDIAYVQVGNGTIDTGTNYSWTRMRGDGTSATSGRSSNDTKWSLPASGTDNVGSTTGILHLQNYSNTTTYKTSLAKQGAAGSDVIAYANLWRSTSAINRIKIYSYTGTAWTTSSTFTLYGIKAA